MTIPLEEGFTVVTGPNGSGKSNILDGVLFCLGLATSRGMRADRLTDLVNSGVLRQGKSAETIVSVRFDLSDWQPDLAEDGLEPPSEGPWIKSNQKEWTVTRRLRVMPGGSYSSSYASDGEACNLQQLQTQLRRLRIDPEGSNVVMQGDVTRIVSMSNRDRRGLIDELAGVALFDNRIEQTRSKLDAVHERQERCEIVQQELLSARQRLERDCAKARTYQSLRDKLQVGKKQELVLSFEASKQELIDLKNESQRLEEKEKRDKHLLLESENKLENAIKALSILQANVKALGEDKLIAVQGEIAGLDTQDRELERQATQHKEEGEKLQTLRQNLFSRRQEIQKENKDKVDQSSEKLLLEAEKSCRDAEAAVEVTRRRLGEVAGRSGAWLEQQRESSLQRQTIQSSLEPLQKEQQKLEERLIQIDERQNELESDLKRDAVENKQVDEQLNRIDEELKKIEANIVDQKQKINQAVEDLSIQQRTRIRLEQEQMKLERDIARLESRRETLHESRGTSALSMLLESGLEGIHGPVAKLGEVDDSQRLALDVAAGVRLGHVVVDDDRIASQAIQLLKKRKAGRLTFLPLNRIITSGNSLNKVLLRGRQSGSNNQSQGCLGRAIDLVRFESIYADVFSYVFGETLVFTNLQSARSQLAKHRAVTLDGELLEKSGAMTGGSFAGKIFSLSFGTTKERDEIEPLRRRLLELGETLIECRKSENIKEKFLNDARPQLRAIEQRQVALEAERSASLRSNEPILEHRRERSERLELMIKTREDHKSRIQEISKEISPLVTTLKELDDENTFDQSEGEAQNWQCLQKDLEVADLTLETARSKRDELLNEQRQRNLDRQRLEDQYKVLLTEEDRLKESVQSLANAHLQWKDEKVNIQNRRQKLENEQKQLQAQFGEERRARDVAEVKVSDLRHKFQESQWNLERLKEDRLTITENLRNGTIRLEELQKNLPDPLPEISDDLRTMGLEVLQAELDQVRQKMEALEPVNMLALEELDQLENRLNDLLEKLQVLSEERSELLLRIETVGTLRQEAFMEAFEAVDRHFREIFASLSEGDGHLQLDNADDPLEGGLTLVAHPKGKAVRRLAAMSGGEKSLTALSFLFALQRFRPSPFYALDEVDSFLDGVNVERLSALISRQAEQAQFLVVSHRRPMIGASHRTIGVTQARGSHTQVVGLPDAA